MARGASSVTVSVEKLRARVIEVQDKEKKDYETAKAAHEVALPEWQKLALAAISKAVEAVTADPTKLEPDHLSSGPSFVVRLPKIKKPMPREPETAAHDEAIRVLDMVSKDDITISADYWHPFNRYIKNRDY